MTREEALRQLNESYCEFSDNYFWVKKFDMLDLIDDIYNSIDSTYDMKNLISKIEYLENELVNLKLVGYSK